MFALTHTCEDCGQQSVLYRGPAVSMPLSHSLAELLVQTEEHHHCAPPPVPEPEVEADGVMPY